MTDSPTLGKLKPPYPVERCASTSCQRPLEEADGAFLFTDLERPGVTGLVVLCDDCARHVELNHAMRFKAVLL